MLSRGEGIIPYPIEKIYEILSNAEKRGDYDQLFDKVLISFFISHRDTL